jgi:hypothetical protein
MSSILGFPKQIGLEQFEMDRAAAEGARQEAVAAAIAAGGGGVGAAVKAADIAFHRAVIASAQKNGVQTGGFQALRDLGAT